MCGSVFYLYLWSRGKVVFEASKEPLYSIGVPGISQLIRNSIITFSGKDPGYVF